MLRIYISRLGGKIYRYGKAGGRGATAVDGSPRLLQVAWQKGRAFELNLLFVT
jgi:hypothetical protein